MRTSILLSLFLFFSACQRESEIENKSNSLLIRAHNLSTLDHFALGVSHIQGDTVVFVDKSGLTLSKFSLVSGIKVSQNLSLIDNFKPSKLHYISTDSILFYDGAHLLLYLNQGFEQIKISLLEGLDDISTEVYDEYPFDRIAKNLVYVKDRKSVIFYFARAKSDKKRIFAEFSLESRTWNSFPVYHPAEFDGVALNYTTFPSVAIGEGGFAFIYSISPTVSWVSFEKKEQIEIQIISFEGKQMAEPQTYRDSWDQDYFENWVLNSPNYLKLLYDPYRKLYYRIGQEALGKDAPLGEDYYSFLLKNGQLYLTVMDAKFQVLKNYPLEKGKYDPSYSFVFSQGLWIPYAEEFIEKENSLEGDLIEFID